MKKWREKRFIKVHNTQNTSPLVCVCVCVLSRWKVEASQKQNKKRKQWWKDSIRSWKINKLKRENSNSKEDWRKVVPRGQNLLRIRKSVCVCVGAKYVQNLRRKSKWQQEKKVNAWNKSSVAEVASGVLLTTLGCVDRGLAECFYWSWVMLWRALWSGCVLEKKVRWCVANQFMKK